MVAAESASSLVRHGAAERRRAGSRFADAVRHLSSWRELDAGVFFSRKKGEILLSKAGLQTGNALSVLSGYTDTRMMCSFTSAPFRGAAVSASYTSASLWNST
jgi:hypothetical protein